MRSRGTSEIVIATVVLVAAGRLVEGIPAAAAAIALAVGVALGALQILADDGSPSVAAGVPVESLITPSVAAFASFGAVHLVPVGVGLIPALVIVAWLERRVLVTEARIVTARTGPSEGERTAVLGEIIACAFVGFVAVAALVPGAIVEPGAVDTVAPTGLQLGVLAVADAIVGLLLGYRAAALRSKSLRDVVWAAAMTAGIIGVAAGALRAIELPRILGPALLTLVFFLWDTVQGGSSGTRPEPRRIREAAVLVLLAVIVVAWSLRLRT